MDYQDYREGKIHGNAVFPFNIYPCAIPEMFTGVLTHWHDEFEIIYIKKGSGIVTVGRESRSLTAPAVVFVLPGQLHAIGQKETEHMEYENIIFHPRLLTGDKGNSFDMEYLLPLFEGLVQIPTFLPASHALFSVLTKPLDACDSEADKQEKYSPLFVKGQLMLLCYHLRANFPVAEETLLQQSSLNQVKPVLTYIHRNYAEKIRIADVAKSVGFSEAYFMRFFRENMGCSFVSYLNEYRLAQAEILLRTTRESVLDIAQETGFPNFSYFIRSFKLKYGTTPLKYHNTYYLTREAESISETE